MSDKLDDQSSATSLNSERSGAKDGGVFATTHWSVVMRAGTAGTGEGSVALDRLCRQYWQPLYYFVRRRGYNEPDAQDLTQGFFARLLEKDLIGAADRERGRFRTFLLTALQNYLANEWDRANRQKRGGGQQFLNMPGAPKQVISSCHRTPPRRISSTSGAGHRRSSKQCCGACARNSTDAAAAEGSMCSRNSSSVIAGNFLCGRRETCWSF